MKSFIYLDLFKMYSLSSQLLEGVTDYILEEKRGSITEQTDQKGPVASGRKIGEIIEETSGNFEKKFLHDYAYSIFEERLSDLNKLFSVDASLEGVEKVSHSKIVKVRGRAKFVDYKEITKSLSSVNSSLQSLGIVTSNNEREELLQKIEDLGGPKRALAGSEVAKLKALSDPTTFAQPENDTLYQKHLCALIDYSFGDSLEVEMFFPGFRVTADLDRGNLRESMQSIVKKYSRISEVEFIMLGVVTQVGEIPEDLEAASITEENTMREAMMANTIALASLENSFRRRAANEIVIDPIAVYVEL